MSESSILLEQRGAVALVTLNRPENANVLNVAMARQLLDTVIAIEANPAVRAVVITGSGKHFCFGGDLRGMMSQGGAVDAYLGELTSFLHTAISHLARMDAPVIAAVNGTAAGGGIGLVSAADLCVCGSSSKFSLAYSGVALTPDCSSSFFLPRIVGHRRAMELILTNRLLGAEEALSWGLVNQVVADAEVLPEALKLADKLAAGPKHAFGKAKRLLAASAGALETQLALEGRTIAAQAATPEGQEGIRAFLDKRKPGYR
jgi:2-(1,2-epoxy-1,2-dihydrophenyl)acetyl-CoA isomerase